MSTYKKADGEIRKLAAGILAEFESHRPLLDAKVAIDFVFAYGDRDEDGNLLNDAIKKNGMRAFGLARNLPIKDRAMGRGDAEITIDGDWWTETANEEMQMALLDHELHHLTVKKSDGQFAYDSVGRPRLKMRKHDVEVGWFSVIAARHGKNSIEQIQAKTICDMYGQYLFPQLIGPIQTIAKVKRLPTSPNKEEPHGHP